MERLLTFSSRGVWKGRGGRGDRVEGTVGGGGGTTDTVEGDDVERRRRVEGRREEGRGRERDVKSLYMMLTLP